MFKKFVFVAVAMFMAANSVMANDDIAAMLANINGAKDHSAQVKEADLLGQKDVDALLGEDDKDSEEAVAACYRRVSHGGNYGSYSNYNNFNYGNYNCNSYSSYNSCNSYCTPYTSCSYSYCAPTYCYTPTTYTCYTPTYSCYSPCYTSYWGCW